MCGIAALLRPGGREVRPDELEQIAARLEHRGPDDRGLAVVAGGRVGLVATRLAIVGLDAPAQPYFNEDGSIVAVVNGELYDHVELAGWLRRRGHDLRTRCDAELVVHLYEELGPQFVADLDGDFALILWDGRARRLLASRDRMGARPLFVREDPHRLMLASELKAFAAPGTRLELAPRYLNTQLLGAHDGRGCALAGIESLPAAALWTWSPEPKRTRYWRWAEAGTGPAPTPDELLEAFDRAVAKRMRADVPTALLFSGGLDSALVAAAAREHAELPAFSIAFSEPRFDESPRARAHAQALGLELELLPIDDEDLAAHLPETIRALELAPINAHCVARYLLARHIRARGIKVVLGGEGSDELFAGYPFFVDEARWRRESGEGRAKLEATVGAGLLEHALERPAHSPLAWACFFEDRAARQARVPSRLLLPRWREEGGPREALRPLLERGRGLSPLRLSRDLALRQLHDYLIPALGDRVEMAHGLEGRPVFFAPELIELGARCDETELIELDAGVGKCVLRRAGARRLAEPIRRVAKHPFLAPSWRRVLATSSGRELERRYLSREAIHDFGVFEPNSLAFILAQWRRLSPERVAGHRYDWVTGLALGVHILMDSFGLV